MAKITLIGFYNYTDGGIFDGLQVPDGLTKSTLVDRIIFEYGEFEPIYANSTYLAHAITNWYNTHKWDMERSWNVLSAEYEPLWNYDRTETATSSGSETISTEGDRTKRNTGTVGEQTANEVTIDGTRKNTGTVGDSANTTTQSSGTGTRENEHKVSAYDSSTYSPDNTDSEDTTNTANASTTGSSTRTDNLTEKTDSTNTESGSATRTDNLMETEDTSGSTERAEQHTNTLNAHGNIGVTTTQNMLMEELEVCKHNWYETYAAMFASDFLIMVY